MSGCVPCQKEEINEFAHTAWSRSHAMAAQIPGLVAAGRLAPTDADAVLNALIEADKCYISAVQTAGALFSSKVASPW